MSDDTPTQKFDPSGDAPTERFTAPAAGEPSEEVVEERKSRKLIIILAAIGGALLIAVIIILILLLTKDNGTPGALPTSSSSSSASPTPSASASATATASPTPTPSQTQDAPPPPPPPSNDVSINSFSGETTSECSSQTQNRVNVFIEWESSNGVAAYFAVGNVNDAESQGQGWTLPPSGNSNDFPNGYVPFEFQCSNASNTYTITVVGTNGSRDSRTTTVQNTGDQF